MRVQLHYPNGCLRRQDLPNYIIGTTTSYTLSDEETGQRGYIIPDKPSYLNPYQSSVGYIRSQLDLIAMMPDYSTKQDLKSLTSL
jgi:hypothetical protein